MRVDTAPACDDASIEADMEHAAGTATRRRADGPDRDQIKNTEIMRRTHSRTQDASALAVGANSQNVCALV